MDGHIDEPAGGMPRIADYWPDAPHRMGPQADFFVDEEARPEAYAPEPHPTRVISPPTAPQRRGLRLVLAILAAVVFLGGSVLALGRLVLHGDDATDTAAPAPTRSAPAGGGVAAQPSPPVSIAPEPTPSAVATTPAPPTSATPTSTTPPFTAGTFELTGDVTVFTMTVADLGADPVRFTTPGDSGLRPRLSRDGSTVRLDPRPDGSEGNGRLEVRLNRRITWSLRMTGGISTATYALTDARLRRIDLTGGAARIDMSLATPEKALPIRMTGGVNTWIITTAEEVPVNVRLRDGAGRVTLNGARTDGIDRDQRVLTGGGKNVDSGGLVIDAVAGLGTLTVRPADGTA